MVDYDLRETVTQQAVDALIQSRTIGRKQGRGWYWVKRHVIPVPERPFGIKESVTMIARWLGRSALFPIRSLAGARSVTKYSETLTEHVMSPRNGGAIEDPGLTGHAGRRAAVHP